MRPVRGEVCAPGSLREEVRPARTEGNRLSFVFRLGRWFRPLIPIEKQYALFLAIDDGGNGAGSGSFRAGGLWVGSKAAASAQVWRLLELSRCIVENRGLEPETTSGQLRGG